MPIGADDVVSAAKAIQVAYPAAKRIGTTFRSFRRSAAGIVFPEITQAGLLASYKDRNEALADIRLAVAHSALILILSNKGDDWLGEHGHLSSIIRQLKGSEKKPEIRTLLMHPEAAWINDYKDGYRGKDRASVRKDYIAAHESIADFCIELGLPRPRLHKQAATWRFVMTDGDVFASTYDNIDKISNVRVDRFSSSSVVYKSLRTQFDFTYDMMAAESGELNALERFSNKHIDFKESAGIVCTRIEGGLRRVLVLEKDGMLLLPKGGIKIDEVASESALREFREETGFIIRPREFKLVGAYVTGQPFSSSVDVKAIAYFHAHEPELELIDKVPNVRWMDANLLGAAKFAYDHVPEVLRKCGMLF